MAKNRNSYLKKSREIEQRQRASDKRARRRGRKQRPGLDNLATDETLVAEKEVPGSNAPGLE